MGWAGQVRGVAPLPKVAAGAPHRGGVAEDPRGGVATGDVRTVTAEERVGEIARMLGHADDPVARRHAEELLRSGQRRAEVGR